MKTRGSNPLGSTTSRSASRPSSRSARGISDGESTDRAARTRAPSRRIRSAQASACVQPGGGPPAISSSISSSVPCRWPMTGTSGATRDAASWTRREVVEVQRVGVGGPGGGQSARPCRHLTLVGVVVERRRTPDPGRRGGPHRTGVSARPPAAGRSGSGRGERLVEGHGMDVKAGVEARGVAERLEVASASPRPP